MYVVVELGSEGLLADSPRVVVGSRDDRAAVIDGDDSSLRTDRRAAATRCTRSGYEAKDPDRSIPRATYRGPRGLSPGVALDFLQVQHEATGAYAIAEHLVRRRGLPLQLSFNDPYRVRRVWPRFGERSAPTSNLV